jgi:hypothetical protein
VTPDSSLRRLAKNARNGILLGLRSDPQPATEPLSNSKQVELIA